MDAATPAVSKYSKRERTPSRLALESVASATKLQTSIRKVREQIEKTDKNEPIEDIPPPPLFDFIPEEDEEKLSDCATIGLKELAYAVFGKGAVDKYLEGTPKAKMSKKLRQIWELSGIEEQCNAVIGKSVDNETKCWICGFEVDKTLNGLKASCEHVLPVAQARFFLDLYNPEYDKDGELTPEKRELLTLEYGWSHFFCNLMKGSGSYLETSSDSRGHIVWRPNKENILKTIDNILSYNTGKKAEQGRFFKESNDVIIRRIKGSRNEWRQSRIDDIIQRKINPILKYLQGPNIDNGRAGLIMLAGVASCMHEDVIRRQFAKFLDVYAIDLKLKEEEAARALIELSKVPEPAYPFTLPTSPEPPSKRKPITKGGRTRRNIHTKK